MKHITRSQLQEIREWIEEQMGDSNNISIHESKIPSHLDLEHFFKVTKEPFGFIKFERGVIK